MSSPVEESVFSVKPLALGERVAILDCGAQYTKVIDRRIRELNVATEIFPLSVDPADLVGFSGIILSGGPHSVYEENAPTYQPGLFDLGIPVLGICYGMQLVNRHFGGVVKAASHKEYGETEIQVSADAVLFQGLEPTQRVLMSHGDSVQVLAPGFEAIGDSNGILAAMMHPEKKVFGVQFHPEVDLTENGSQILANFLFQVCQLQGTYKLENRLEEVLQSLRQTIGSRQVFVLVSGGVDSSVTAALLLKALGPEQVYGVHIDSGFMRHQESDLVCDALQQVGFKHLRRINAQEIFLNATTEMDGETVGPLNTVTDPEQKRRIIGDVFYRLINQAIEEAGLDMATTFIAQGTLRPDLIESGNREVSQTAHKIKTHHNDVPLIRAQREKGLIVEPNRDWHKDEVRQVGRLLGLPEELVIRQPFPGPGLAIRVLCTEQPYITEDYDSLNQQLKAKAKTAGFEALLLPVQSVGVQGDGRTYRYLAVVAGPYASKSWEDLRTLAREIPNQIHGINRVALLLNYHQLPEEWKTITPTTLQPETLEVLRQVDHQVTQQLTQAGCNAKISQLLSVLVPVDTRNQRGHSIALRAVVTSDYMTARPAALGTPELPWPVVQQLVQTLSNQPHLDFILYDLTSKPPATVEWE